MQLFPAISEVKVECSGCGDVLKIITSIFVSNNSSHHPYLGCSPKANKIFFFQLKMDSYVVLSRDSEYMTQSGQFGR